MTDAASGMVTYPSATAIRTCTTTKATDSSDRFRCSPVTANLGRPSTVPAGRPPALPVPGPWRLISRPSSATAVSSSRATTPVARLPYHSQVEELVALTVDSMTGEAEAGIRAGHEESLRQAVSQSK